MCDKCRFPLKMCQCNNYKAIAAKKAESARLAHLRSQLKKSATQNSHNGNVNFLKDSYYGFLKKANEDREWRQQQYNSLLRQELSRK